MHRLISSFAGRTYHTDGNLVLRLKLSLYTMIKTQHVVLLRYCTLLEKRLVISDSVMLVGCADYKTSITCIYLWKVKISWDK